MSNFSIGDHLVASRVLYQHHGLYMGDNKVIHYSNLGFQMNAYKVCISSLASFSQGYNISIHPHPKRKFDGKTSIKRAISRLGEREYNLLSNNCEHFIMWCIEGDKVSPQISNAYTQFSALHLLSKSHQYEVNSRLLSSSILPHILKCNPVTSISTMIFSNLLRRVKIQA